MKGFAKLKMNDGYKTIYKDLTENNYCKKIVLDIENHFVNEKLVNIKEELASNNNIYYFKKIPPKGKIGIIKNSEYIYFYKFIRENLYLKYKYTIKPFEIKYYYYCNLGEENNSADIVFIDKNKMNRYLYKYLKK